MISRDRSGNYFLAAMHLPTPNHSSELPTTKGSPFRLILPGALVSVLLILAAFDRAGFYSDDSVMSLWGVEAAASGKNSWQFACYLLKQFWSAQGRLAPGSALFNLSWITAVGENLSAYRLVHQLGNLAALSSVVWLVSELTSSLRAGVVAALLMASMFCITTPYDSLLSFGLLMPLVMVFGCCGLAVHLRAIRSTHCHWLMLLAFLCATCSVLTYEFGLAFILGHLAIETTQPRDQRKLSRAYPFLLLGIAIVLVNLLAKKTGQYVGASIGTLDPAIILRTYFIQVLGTLPLVAPLAQPSASVWASTSRAPTSLVLAVGLSVAVTLFLAIGVRRITTFERVRVVLVGLCLYLFPPLLTAISSKYQRELIFGQFYLQGYMQFAGQALIASAFIFSIGGIENRFLRTSLKVLACGAVAFIASFLWSWNTRAVDSLNQSWRLPRESLSVALEDYTKSIDGPVSIIVDRDSLAGWENSKFVRAHASRDGDFIEIWKAAPFAAFGASGVTRIFVAYQIPAHGSSWVFIGQCTSLTVGGSGQRVLQLVPGSVRLYNWERDLAPSPNFYRLGRYLPNAGITGVAQLSDPKGRFIALATTEIEIKP